MDEQSTTKDKQASFVKQFESTEESNKPKNTESTSVIVDRFGHKIWKNRNEYRQVNIFKMQS